MKKTAVLALLCLFVIGLLSGYHKLKTANAADSDRQFSLPVNLGRISTNFGWQKAKFTDTLSFHRGIDLPADIGTTVMAAMDGTVCMTGNNRNYGQYVILNHKDDYQSFYAHLSVISVNNGDKVTKGMKIGEAGMTGYTSGSQLHFGIFKNKKAVDPCRTLQ